jgi:hypothetical protein
VLEQSLKIQLGRYVFFFAIDHYAHKKTRIGNFRLFGSQSSNTDFVNCA